MQTCYTVYAYLLRLVYADLLHRVTRKAIFRGITNGYINIIPSCFRIVLYLTSFLIFCHFFPISILRPLKSGRGWWGWTGVYLTQWYILLCVAHWGCWLFVYLLPIRLFHVVIVISVIGSQTHNVWQNEINWLQRNVSFFISNRRKLLIVWHKLREIFHSTQNVAIIAGKALPLYNIK